MDYGQAVDGEGLVSWPYKQAQECFRVSDPKFYKLTLSMDFVYAADSASPDSKDKSVFYNVATAIVYQSISVESADAVHRRLLNLFNGDISAPKLLNTPDEALRAVGLPYRKVGYLKNLARAVLDDLPATEAFENVSDDDVIKALTGVKGVGLWTAQMYLMFTLQRLDVLPSNDLGLQIAAGNLYDFARKMTPQELSGAGEKWRPYRTIASVYLWQSRGESHTAILKRLLS